MNTRLPVKELVDIVLKRSPHAIYAVGAAIFDKSGVFQWGWNHYGIHAETHAINRANPKRLKGASIVIACRAKKKNGKFYPNLHLARPCPDCMSKIMKAGIAHIIYSDPYHKDKWAEIEIVYK